MGHIFEFQKVFDIFAKALDLERLHRFFSANAVIDMAKLKILELPSLIMRVEIM
jgi:hypothetical protein